jgi:hypothetical protein
MDGEGEVSLGVPVLTSNRAIAPVNQSLVRRSCVSQSHCRGVRIDRSEMKSFI